MNEQRTKKKSYKRDVLEIVVAFVAAWLFYQGLAFATGTPMPIVSVVSDSMLPILHQGDLLFVVRENVAIGDIAIYQQPGSSFTIVHRIVGMDGEQYIFKGDNNQVNDPRPVTREQILGKVWFATPLLGYPRMVLHLIGI